MNGQESVLEESVESVSVCVCERERESKRMCVSVGDSGGWL